MFLFGARAAQDDESALHALGDFTANTRLLLLSSVAILIGIISAYVAVGPPVPHHFFTNLFFFQRLSFAAASPAAHMLGGLVVIVPVIGGGIIGLMARYGSDRIRGHGIPEAIESILINGSRVEPKLAILKPLSSAIAIGSGGPFGAEGPIIMTGGAFGSLVAQFLHPVERRAQDAARGGRRAGMSRPSRRRSRRCCSRSNCCSSSGSRAASSRSRWRA
jgi:H+/Cl- antiporter ClcA